MAGDFEREKEKSGTEGLGQDHTREDPQILLWWQRRKRNRDTETHTRCVCPHTFPGGPVVENPPFNAGHTGSIPDQETKIPH